MQMKLSEQETEKVGRRTAHKSADERIPPRLKFKVPAVPCDDRWLKDTRGSGHRANL